MIFDPLYLAIMGGTMLLSWLAGSQLKRKFELYSQMPIALSGAEIAKRMLVENGISDVDVISTPGQLTDHYHPGKKTVNLSESVYAQRNVAAAAVAAHEVGHAVQHAKAYPALQMRSALVPVVSFGSNISQYVILAGLLLMGTSAAGGGIGGPIMVVGICLFAMTTLFSVITLPVEFDASNRALVWLNRSGIAVGREQEMAKDALKWAAMTYIVGALASLGQLVYWIMIYLRRR
ncbi:MAG: zinc metallopeptidase [Verrucomicrobiota bacterium]